MIQLQYLNRIIDKQDSSLITLNNLTDEFFSDYKDEFNFIKNHLNKYGTIPDKVTFLNIFPDFNLFEVNESDKYLLDALYEDRNKRLLAFTFNKIREALNNNDTEKAMSIYESSSEKLLTAKHLESIDIIKDLNRYDAYVEKTTNFSKFYVRTGFPELDEVIGGWDRKEELVTLFARPGVGKSWVLLKIALAAAEQGLNVGIYSGEMSENKVGYRLDTLISHISNTKLLRGNSNVMVDYKKYLDDLPNKFKGSIKILTPKSINGVAGVQALRAFVEKDKLDILCVDQHSLLEDDRKAKNAIEKASNISKDLKNLQVIKGIPIITVSQQNREKNDNGIVDTTNISQSDRIGQDSTIVIALEQKDNILTLKLAKTRDSCSNNNTLKYYIDFDKGLFQFIPEEKDATQGTKCIELKNEFEEEIEEEESPF